MASRPNCFLCTADWSMLLVDIDQSWRGNRNMCQLPRIPLKPPNYQLWTFSALISYLCVLGTQQRLGYTTFVHMWVPNLVANETSTRHFKQVSVSCGGTVELLFYHVMPFPLEHTESARKSWRLSTMKRYPDITYSDSIAIKPSKSLLSRVYNKDGLSGHSFIGDLHTTRLSSKQLAL